MANGASLVRMSTNPIQITWPLKKPQQLVYVELGSQNGGMMLGVCEVGLTFRAVAPLQANGPLPFSFALDGKSRLQGIGEIAWAEDDGKTGGLKFTDVSTEFHAALRAWLAGESSQKSVGREITPAAALPLDSLEKIKASIREGNIEEIKAVAPARPIEEKQPQISLPETRPAEIKSDEISVPAALPEMPAFSVIPAHPGAHSPAESNKGYPLLQGLDQPYAHILPEAEEIEDSPRLNRAAAAGIIALALTVILVALVLSFRREVGETLIRLGEKLAGEQRAAVVDSHADALKPVATAPSNVTSSQPRTLSVPDNAQPNTSSPVSIAPVQPAKIQRIEDLSAATDGGSGQKEFEQARNILKGNHRLRDLSLAVDLLWTGVRKGYVPAEVTLADLYARGDGVEQSCEQARVLLRAAVQKGSPEGRRRLDQLNRQGCPFN